MPSPLNLSAEDYWADFTRTRDEFAKFISETGFRGLRIDGPAFVAIDRRESLPVVGYYARTLREDLRVDPEGQMIAAAFDLTTRQLHAGLALDNGKTPDRDDPIPPGDEPAEGLTFTAFSSDLRLHLDILWQKRKLLTAFFICEHVSNPVLVELGPSPAAFRDPAVEEFLAQQRAKAAMVPPRPISPEAKSELGVTYQRISRSPPIPEKRGIALSLERVVVAQRGASCLCFGAFRLPVTFGDVVRPDIESGQLPDVGHPDTRAVVPITFLVTGSKTAGPWILEMRVPSFDAVALPKGPPPPPDEEVGEVTGYFALDLWNQPSMPRAPMTYFLSAFGGGSLSGPFQFAVVTEQMLRDSTT